MKNRFDISFKLCCSLLLLLLSPPSPLFLALSEATASTQNELDIVGEENNSNGAKTTLASAHKPLRKLAGRKNRGTPYSDLITTQDGAKTCVEDLSCSLGALTLSDKPSEHLLSFSTPISMDKLWLDFGKLPQKLAKHRKTYEHLLTKDMAPFIEQFIETLKGLVDNQLLLRADNLELFLSLEILPKDYASLSLFNANLDETTINNYATQLIVHYNDIPAQVSPRYSRFQNQWTALEIIKEEVFDYITEQRSSLPETGLLSSKLIGLTIDMVLPFYDFVKKYETLISDMADERAQFFQLMYKHGGITKKTIQFEQAMRSFPSLIGDFKAAARLAQEREAEEARIALEKATLSDHPSPVQDSKKAHPSPRKSSSGQDATKRTPFLRSTLSLDLTWLHPAPHKHSPTAASKNFTQSAGETSSIGEQKKRFSSPRKYSPTLGPKKSTASNGESPQSLLLSSSTQDSSPMVELVSLVALVSSSDGSPIVPDSEMVNPSLHKLSRSESPSTGERNKRTNSLHKITTSELSKTPSLLLRKSSPHTSPIRSEPHHTSLNFEAEALELLMQDLFPRVDLKKLTPSTQESTPIQNRTRDKTPLRSKTPDQESSTAHTQGKLWGHLSTHNSEEK
jgi:hypothetical protein